MSQLVPTNNINAYLDYMEKKEATIQGGKPLPKYVRLDGNTGVYTIKKYDSSTKESSNENFLDGTGFDGVILTVRFFCKWKFDEGAKVNFRTREFQNWDHESIELLKIDYTNKDSNKETVATYEDYRAFKAKHTKTDELTGKTSSPYDVFVSLYVYVPQLDEVINYRFKGDTRSAWFDYQNNWKLGNERHISQVLTHFGVSDKKELATKNAETGKPNFYFAGTFLSIRKNSDSEMVKVMHFVSELMAWIRSFDNSISSEDETVGATVMVDSLNYLAPPTDEIDLSQIPF